MEQIYDLKQILEVLENMDTVDIVDSIEKDFGAYSQGKVVVPPVGELLFKDPPGDVHIQCTINRQLRGFSQKGLRYTGPAHSREWWNVGIVE